jgi:transposase-like protein
VDQPIEELRLSVLTRQHVEAVIREMGPERAWKALGVARTTLYRWMREWKEAGNGK